MNAIESARWIEAAEIADDLLEWIGRGGFIPKITGHILTDKLLLKGLCESVAAWNIAD